ncbi:MAG: hypothetical protein H5U36_02670 [Candidatus Caldatribacterium sp.]|nr:hypothetical protein [Candidatus Caldatribacterium sp.]
MRKIFVFLEATLAVVLLLSFFGCQRECPLCGGIRGTGTVTYVPLEGGFFGIVADNGKRYEPVNLPEDFREDGLRVAFVAEPFEGMSSHMWGELIRLVRIEKLPF